MEGHKKFVHFYGLKLKVPYGRKWLTVDPDGTVKVWHDKPALFFGAWWDGKGFEAVDMLDDMKKLDWRDSLTEIEYKTQRDQVVAALKTPMTIIELFKKLPEISPDVIAPHVTNLYTDGYVFKVGSKLEQWKTTEKEHYVYSSRLEDEAKDPRSKKVASNIYTNLIGVRPPPAELCTGKKVHACNDDEF